MMNRKKQVAKYVVADFLTALLAWVLFFVFRKITIENGGFEDINHVFDDRNLYFGVVFVPLFWLFLYYAQGCYKDVYRKSRLRELSQTFWISVTGIVIIFFALLLDDYVGTYRNYYLSFVILLASHFVLTYFPRLIITSSTVRKIHSRKIGFPTLIIGNQKRALTLYNELQSQKIYSGNLFIGYISQCKKGNAESAFSNEIPCLGNIEQLKDIIKMYKVEELIIALESDDESKLYKIVSSLESISNLQIKIPADRKDILLGRVKMTAIFLTPLILISQQLMPQWQVVLKRLMDIVISLLAIVVLLPVYIITSVIVWSTSKGHIFYRQERIGYKGKPFYMHKFRSMYVDAEEKGVPMLSNDNDSRITPFGKFMRKVRLDEIPQFYNVLRGTMSLVGPRPERQYFIDQIVKQAPEYRLLHNIKPGITSWGQVKFGYAENVDEMVERLKYDLLYLENISLITDIKILLYTVIIVFQGRGK
ncbi:MAG: sugar transferase [Bacteroidales bacterium]|jgi:exopolysaccharide biosynthesis polyprenyl glycosylphosphotransferase|nr:sugar transferase [Bacteroidales bacterium]